jgi:hypothetical protein
MYNKYSRLIEIFHQQACLATLPDPSGRLEIRSLKSIRRAPVVSVPIAEVLNTLVSWLC